MREEISEPQHWRGRTERSTPRNNSWSSRRRTHEHKELPVDAVDAAFDQPDGELKADETLNANDVISNLSKHLELLEQQREQIQRLLEEAQGS